jgi:hypothetical protein
LKFVAPAEAGAQIYSLDARLREHDGSRLHCPGSIGLGHIPCNAEATRLANAMAYLHSRECEDDS